MEPTAHLPRLFVAVWPDPPMVELLSSLPRTDRPGVRWVPPEQCHVTLRFLGAADPDRVAELLSTLRHPPVTAVVGPRVGRLGRGVLMVPVEGLDSLATSVTGCTAEVGRPPDPRPFLGHITLARLKGRPACGLTETTVTGEWSVTTVALVSSTTLPDGPHYRTLLEVPLAGR